MVLVICKPFPTYIQQDTDVFSVGHASLIAARGTFSIEAAQIWSSDKWRVEDEDADVTRQVPKVSFAWRSEKTLMSSFSFIIIIYE